jgi:flagellar motor switch protein FliM
MEANLPPEKEQSAPAEVEDLSSQVGGSNPPAATVAPTTQKTASRAPVFRKLSAFSATELRKLKARQEEFARALAGRLSAHLHLEVGLKISRLETVAFGKLMGELSNPTYLALFRLEPLKAACLMEVPSQLGLSIVDRELGGAGECSEKDRSLTEIESRILSRIVELTVSEWCTSWSDLQELKPVLTGHESNSAFVQSHPADTMMLVIGVEMQLGELTKPMLFAFPYPAFEPLIKKLNTESEAEKKSVAKTAVAALKWNPAYDDVAIKVTVEIPSLKIKTNELAKLKAGDVITLDSEAFQHLRLSLAQKPKFVASAGRSGPHWAAKITKLIET